MKFEPKETQKFETERQLLLARFSPCGSILAAGGMDGRIHRWEAGKKLTPLPPIEGHRAWVAALAFHPMGDLLFTADSWGRLRCQDYEGERPRTFWTRESAHDGWIRGLDADASHVVSCGRDGAVRVWTRGGEPVAERKVDEELFAVAIHPDGRQIVFGDLKGSIRAWDFAADKIVREFDGKVFYKYDRIQDIGGLRRLFFTEEGRTLVAAGGAPTRGATVQAIPTICLYDFAKGKLKKQIQHGQAKDGYVEDAAVHPSGWLVAVSSGVTGNGRIFAVQPDGEKPFYSHTKIANCHAVALHPDGRRYAVTATNRNSNGNGRRLDKEGKYPGNVSPVHLFELAEE